MNSSVAFIVFVILAFLARYDTLLALTQLGPCILLHVMSAWCAASRVGPGRPSTSLLAGGRGRRVSLWGASLVCMLWWTVKLFELASETEWLRSAWQGFMNLADSYMQWCQSGGHWVDFAYSLPPIVLPFFVRIDEAASDLYRAHQPFILAVWQSYVTWIVLVSVAAIMLTSAIMDHSRTKIVRAKQQQQSVKFWQWHDDLSPVERTSIRLSLLQRMTGRWVNGTKTVSRPCSAVPVKVTLIPDAKLVTTSNKVGSILTVVFIIAMTIAFSGFTSPGQSSSLQQLRQPFATSIVNVTHVAFRIGHNETETLHFSDTVFSASSFSNHDSLFSGMISIAMAPAYRDIVSVLSHMLHFIMLAPCIASQCVIFSGLLRSSDSTSISSAKNSGQHDAGSCSASSSGSDGTCVNHSSSGSSSSSSACGTKTGPALGGTFHEVTSTSGASNITLPSGPLKSSDGTMYPSNEPGMLSLARRPSREYPIFTRLASICNLPCVLGSACAGFSGSTPVAATLVSCSSATGSAPVVTGQDGVEEPTLYHKVGAAGFGHLSGYLSPSCSVSTNALCICRAFIVSILSMMMFSFTSPILSSVLGFSAHSILQTLTTVVLSFTPQLWEMRKSTRKVMTMAQLVWSVVFAFTSFMISGMLGFSAYLILHSLTVVALSFAPLWWGSKKSTRIMVMTAQQVRSKYPDIRSNLQGMALKEELDKFIDFCLTEQATGNPRDEEFDIAQLHASAGRHSAIGLLLSTPDTALDNKTPVEHAEDIAMAARMEFQRRRRAQTLHEGEETDLLHQMTLEAYPEYVSDPELLSSLQYWEELAQDVTQPYQDVVAAQQTAAQIKAELVQLEHVHNHRNPEAKLDWMKTQPAWERVAKHIEEAVNRDFQRRRLTLQDHQRNYRKFGHAQFKRPEDFQALRWLRDYIIRRVGAITEFHAEKFRSRRMCLGETPMEAVAKLLDDADVLSKAGLYDFNPHSEVYRIISKKDLPGGPFFTKPLYEVIEHIIRYQIAERPDIINDPYQMILIWRDTAQREFDQVPGQDADLDARIQTELQKRGHPPKWSTTTRAELAKHAKESQKGKSLYCETHGWGGHATETCRTKPRGDASTLMTTTMSPDMDPLSKGVNPNSKYNQRAPQGAGEERKTGDQRTRSRRRNQHPECPNCTKIAGQPVSHDPSSCYTDGSTAAPDWFRTRHDSILRAANAVRVKHGLKPIEQQPRTAMWMRQPSRPVGDAVLRAEPPMPSFEEVGTIALMMRPSSNADPEENIRTQSELQRLVTAGQRPRPTPPVGLGSQEVAPFGSRFVTADTSTAASVNQSNPSAQLTLPRAFPSELVRQAKAAVRFKTHEPPNSFDHRLHAIQSGSHSAFIKMIKIAALIKEEGRTDFRMQAMAALLETVEGTQKDTMTSLYRSILQCPVTPTIGTSEAFPSTTHVREEVEAEPRATASEFVKSTQSILQQRMAYLAEAPRQSLLPASDRGKEPVLHEPKVLPTVPPPRCAEDGSEPIGTSHPRPTLSDPTEPWPFMNTPSLLNRQLLELQSIQSIVVEDLYEKVPRMRLEFQSISLELKEASKGLHQVINAELPRLTVDVQRTMTQTDQLSEDVRVIRQQVAALQTQQTELERSMSLRMQSMQDMITGSVKDMSEAFQRAVQRVIPTTSTPSVVFGAASVLPELTTMQSRVSALEERTAVHRKEYDENLVEICKKIDELDLQAKAMAPDETLPQTVFCMSNSIARIKERETTYEHDMLMLWGHVKNIRDHFYPGWRHETAYLAEGGCELQELDPISWVEKWYQPMRLKPCDAFTRPSISRHARHKLSAAQPTSSEGTTTSGVEERPYNFGPATQPSTASPALGEDVTSTRQGKEPALRDAILRQPSTSTVTYLGL